MSTCAISVTFSAANISSYTQTVAPSGFTGLFGNQPVKDDQIIVKGERGVVHRYSAEALSGLRLPGATDDQWGYFPDGLRFLKGDLPLTPTNKAPDYGCET